MSKDTQLRFYDVSEYFGDDERVMAHAIKEFLSVKETADDIYTDLLDCEFDRWLNQLEQIIDTIKHDILTKWIKSISSKFKDGIWIKGDAVVLTERAWKLKSVAKPKSKVHAVKIKRQMTFYDLGGW